MEVQNKKPNCWLFPGQGFQKLDMEMNLLEISFASSRFDRASAILGWSLVNVINDRSLLCQTKFIQPLLFTIASVYIDLLRDRGQRPDLLAGYSFGEYPALYAAKVFDFETGLRLVKSRGKIMETAPSGRMVTLIGCDFLALERLIRDTPGVWIINDNHTHAVVSGAIDSVNSLVNKIAAKRVIHLKPDIPFHTPLVADAAREFDRLVRSLYFKPASVPILSSVSLEPTNEVAKIKENLVKQITQPVRWCKLTQKLVKLGIKGAIELSQSQSLNRQMRLIAPSISKTNISNYTTEGWNDAA